MGCMETGQGAGRNRKGQGRGGEAPSQDSQQLLSSPTWSVSPGGTLRRAASQGGQVLRSRCAWGGMFSCRPKGPPKTSIPGAGGLGEGGRPRISPGLLAGPSGAAPFLLGFLGLRGDRKGRLSAASGTLSRPFWTPSLATPGPWLVMSELVHLGRPVGATSTPAAAGRFRDGSWVGGGWCARQPDPGSGNRTWVF